MKITLKDFNIEIISANKMRKMPMQNESPLHDVDHNDFSIEMRDRDHAVALLPNLDYEAQLSAIKNLLKKHLQDDELLSEKIKQKKNDMQQGGGSQRAIDEWIERLEESVYQDAAHSMAAVGMLAPFVESVFYQAFQKIRDYYNAQSLDQQSYPRWQNAEKIGWNCHYIFKNGKRNKNLVEGILQLAETVDMLTFLPDKTPSYLKALFAYRNKMFHNGFEWPESERKKFANFIKQEKCSSWFGFARTNNGPWIYYMTKEYISESIALIDQIINGIGKYAKNSYLIIGRTTIKKPDYID